MTALPVAPSSLDGRPTLITIVSSVGTYLQIDQTSRSSNASYRWRIDQPCMPTAGD